MSAQIGVGFALGALIGYLAYRAGALSPSGGWAAALVGGLIFGLGGLAWATLLLTFFISSSLLSRAFAARKASLSEKFSKGARRDYAQVLANGGLGALLVLVHGLFPGQAWPWIAFAGAMAAVNADTWATELGVLNPQPPRLITTGEAVETGASGGVSASGYLAALSGAGLIGLGGVLFMRGSGAWIFLGAAVLGGLAGTSFDSLLGATVQAIYFCPACGKETEHHPLHRCGTTTAWRRGWAWLNNDLVNLGASLVGAAVGLIGWYLGQVFLG